MADEEAERIAKAIGASNVIELTKDDLRDLLKWHKDRSLAIQLEQIRRQVVCAKEGEHGHEYPRYRRQSRGDWFWFCTNCDLLLAGAQEEDDGGREAV